ncbi:MAG: hypothetical protein Q7S86_05455 [bacterium]|nr:hypothetical protein [bacterium]
MKKLRSLSKQLLGSLEERARAEGIIPPNGHLSVVVSISDNSKLEIRTRTKALLSMTPPEFFTDERFALAGQVVANNKTRMLHMLASDRLFPEYPTRFPVQTVGDMLKIRRECYLRMRNFSSTGLAVMECLLATEGLKLSE